MIDFILHVDSYLLALVAHYGSWVGILFLIVFIETGVVAMPFLPGDGLWFAAGPWPAWVLWICQLCWLLFRGGGAGRQL